MENKLSTKQLNNISETMLITVWARAVETKRQQGLLDDPIAVDVMNRIDYDFSVFKKSHMSQVGCCIRGKLIDEHTQSFIAKHPDAVVIQLGAGLDTRFQRLHCPDITHWYDLDLAEAIEIRERLCPSHPNNTLLAMSMLEEAWIDTVQAHNKPVLIIIEGVLMYFEEAVVKQFFEMLCHHFEQTTVLIDMLGFAAVNHSKYHDTAKHTQQAVEFKWSVLNSKELEQWHDKLHVGVEQYMSDFAGNRFPWWYRLLCKTPWGYQRTNQRILRLDIGESL